MSRRLLAVALLLTGCATGTPHQEPDSSAASFALLGDAPYSQPHANLLDDMIDEINQAKPAFVVHLGDITGGRGPCTDDWFDARKAQFARFAYPFVLIPGDNEWTDCHRTGFDPLERLRKIRALFHSQSPALPEFSRQSAAWPEHLRWRFGGTLFIALNVPGSNNNLGRTPQMDAEYAARMVAVFEWLEQAVRLAATPRFQTLVVLFHANPDFEGMRKPHGIADGYETLRAALEKAARKLGKPVVVAHGDTHRFKNDKPMANFPNLFRIEVDGWPALGWLTVQRSLSGPAPFLATRILHH